MIIFLFFSLFWAALLLGITEKGLNSQYVWLVLGSILIYWGGAYTNAPDTKGYMFFFDLVSVNGWVLDSLYGSSAGAMEPGTFIIMQLCKQISGSYYLFQFVILSIDIILTYWGIKKISNNNAYIVVFFFVIHLHDTFLFGSNASGSCYRNHDFLLALLPRKQILYLRSIIDIGNFFSSERYPFDLYSCTDIIVAEV